MTKIYTVIMRKRGREIARFDYSKLEVAHQVADMYLDAGARGELRSVNVQVSYK